MTSVELSHVTKTYGAAAPSVDDLSLTIEDGEFFTLLGPSGCGKSTTLRMVAGFVAPTSGTIRFGERDVTSAPPYKRDTGMVFQSYALFPHMDVAENVGYGLRMRKVATAERRTRVDEALAVVGLAGYGERRIDQLSGGQQQRVALARALVVQPSVLLLDEPLSNLDAKLRDETRSQIREIQRKAGTTSVYVTHDQAEAMAMSDRIAVMNGGVLHQLGEPREVYRRPATAFVARFIGRSNVLPGVVEGRDGGTAAVRLTDGSLLHAPVAVDGGAGDVAVGDEIALSVRSEAVELLGPAPAAADRAEGTIHARLAMVEFTGSSCMLGLDLLDGADDEAAGQADRRILITIPDTDDLPRTGDVVALRPDPARIWMVAR